MGELYSVEMSKRFGFPRREESELLEQRHRDIAHSAQAMYEEILFNILENAYSIYGIKNLTLAGGCAMNSVENGKVYRRSRFKNIYIQSAAGDAGGAIGSAFTVANRVDNPAKRFRMKHAYWGPSFSNSYHRQILDDRAEDLRSAGCVTKLIDNEARLCLLTANAIIAGLVIGWFQGRMEWGPRVLGNRSILSDPRRADMKDILNSKIKRRNHFDHSLPRYFVRTSLSGSKKMMMCLS